MATLEAPGILNKLFQHKSDVLNNYNDQYHHHHHHHHHRHYFYYDHDHDNGYRYHHLRQHDYLGNYATGAVDDDHGDDKHDDHHDHDHDHDEHDDNNEEPNSDMSYDQRNAVNDSIHNPGNAHSKGQITLQ